MLILTPETAETTATNAGLLVDATKYAGYGLWSAAYIFFIVRGYKDKSYGVPLISVCLNFTWELYFAVLCRPKVLDHLGPELLRRLGMQPETKFCTATGMEYWGLFFWLVLDTVILIQLFLYGWRSEPTLLRYLPERARRTIFNEFVLVLLLIALYWQYAFVNLLTDRDGNSLAWLTNYIMSWLFVSSAFFRRPDARGLSFWGGCAMLGGNIGFTAYAVSTNFAEFTTWPVQFTVVLMAGVIWVNAFYLDVLTFKTRTAKVLVPDVVGQPVTT
jgi:hypothetical protein